MRRLALFAALFAAPLAAQQPAFDFSIANMMRGPELYGREPANVRWTPDGQWIYFQWLPAGSGWRETLKPYRVRAQAGAKPERITDAQADSVAPLLADGSLSPDRLRRVVSVRGDLFVVDVKKSVARRLTETVAVETNPRFSPDGQRVLFVRDGNAWSIDLATAATRQLTDIRTADASGAARGGASAATANRAGANSQRGALERDQRVLLEVIRDRLSDDSTRKAESAARDSAGIRPVTLAAGERLGLLSVSPSGTAVLFTTSTAAADARNGIVPNYVTPTGYTEDIPNRTKVGDAQPRTRLGYQALPRGEVKWLRSIAGDSAFPVIANSQIVAWNDAGTTALVVGSASSFKTRQLSTLDAATGVLKPVNVMRDSAWVGGPCSFGCAGFYDNDTRIYFVDESTGWAQLYSTAVDGSDRRALTSGQFEIYDVELSADRKYFLFHSSEISAFDRDFYRMPIAGGARQRLTVGVGSHSVTPSPDEKLLADVQSTTRRSPDLFLATACPPAAMCKSAPASQLTVSQSADWLAFKWIDPAIVMIPASDGVQVPAHIYRPEDIGAKPNGAAVIFVHGAGYLHNVGHFWSQYPREFMFNNYLASKGYVVLDLDYRASAGYGRDWRTAIYRFMGGRDLQDQVDASRWLEKTYRINPERVGMYGGSYGGFMTLMALFTEPKRFGAGAALRSVTDWAHYNHGYTGSILNLPQTDTLAYHRSSPIFHAEGLEDPLLMLHGMVDTNVNFQDIVRLTQRLIELGKPGWDLAVYPVEDHGFVRPSSWTDEYTRIFNHFERTIGPNGTKAAP
ncbi:MAG: S9 family peptidase [Gemmatimonadetes bacterium]|nr:S9 family peptidase [Gemmatimonadota bacterium]